MTELKNILFRWLIFFGGIILVVMAASFVSLCLGGLWDLQDKTINWTAGYLCGLGLYAVINIARKIK